MEVQVDDLSLTQLDYFVGLAEGKDVKIIKFDGDHEPYCLEYSDLYKEHRFLYSPTSYLEIASVIIDREKINMSPCYNQRGDFICWEAKSLKWVLVGSGSTYVIAALRAYVMHKFGEVVTV